MLLAIDTSAGTSVAVVDRDGGILSQADVADTMRHAEVIGSLITSALAGAGIGPHELSGVVSGMGPGPFTGLRVGISAARTFAFALGRPLVPVASHDGVAWQHYASGATGGLVVVTDARRREVFWSAYSGADADGLPQRTEGPALAKPDAVPYPELHRIDAATIPAGGLGMVAELAFAGGHPFAADEPLYLRSPDVTPSNGPKRVTR